MNVFFTDRDLGKTFPETLRSAGLAVERHADHFAPDCPDEDWLKVIGELGWIAITHDARIRYKPNERYAVMAFKVALLVVVGNARHSELASGFVAMRDRTLRFVEKHDPPYIARVYCSPVVDPKRKTAQQGRIELWCSQ